MIPLTTQMKKSIKPLQPNLGQTTARNLGQKLVFLMSFTPYRTEQPLQDMELQEKEEDNAENRIGKLIKWSPKIKCLLILDVKPFRSQVKGMHYAGKEVQSLAVLGKKLLT